MNDNLKPTSLNPIQQNNNFAEENILSSNRAASSFTPTKLIYVALVAVVILLIAQWWSSTNQINQLREELARRLQSVDVSNAETKTIAKSVQETDKELQVKIGVLENKLVESESHALALQQLYQDLSKNRDDWALSEIEQVLSTASQQLQLGGNVQGALIALQNADARLARSDKAQFITIRRSIAHDINRLKSLPNLDLPGIAVRLDSAISQIESMPLWVDENPVVATTPVKARESTKSNTAKKTSKHAPNVANSKGNKIIDQAEVKVAGTAANWMHWLGDRWQSGTTEMWLQLRQLIRIRDVGNPDALLLSPAQGYFAKENVKLRLLNARLALLSHSETSFKNDVIAAQVEIARYFDTRAKQTQAVQALLRQIQNSNVSIEIPSLAESINAVRNFTVKQ